MNENSFSHFDFIRAHRIRTRVYAQGFVVSLLTAAAVYQAVKGRPDPRARHGQGKLQQEKQTSSHPH